MFTYEDVVSTANQLELFSLLENHEGFTPIDDFFFVYIDSHYNVAPMSYPDVYIKKLFHDSLIVEDLTKSYGTEMYELLTFMVNVMEKNVDLYYVGVTEPYAFNGENNEEL